MAPITKQKPPVPKKQGSAPKSPLKKKGSGFTGNFISTILLLLLIMSAVTFFISPHGKPEEIAVSQVAADVKAGTVSNILVSGNELSLTYTDEAKTEKVSRKDSATSLPEVLAVYGVTPEELAKVVIGIKGESGFRFWFGTLAPLLIPIIFLVFLFWFLTRQVKGSGMQAFTFGQSKARMIDPTDSA